MKNINRAYDAVIIGSGAAGSVMAYELSKAGLSVIVLEKGKYENPQTFTHDELDMYSRVYKNGGLQTTSDNDLSIVQGQTVGGSTVINNAIWIRPNVAKVLTKWEENEAFINEERLEECYEYVENKLGIQPLDKKVANKGSEDFLKACSRLGHDANYLQNNRKECLGCGWCNYGCRYNRKASMLVTFIPWAEKHGAIICDQVSDIKINNKYKKIESVTFIRKNNSYTVTCKKVIVSAGAIGSSEVLLKNKINPNGQVGKGLHFLGGFLTSGILDKQVNGYDGIGLTCIANISDEYLIETFFSPPGILSPSLGGWFADHNIFMKDYAKMFQIGVMVGSEPTGRIKLSRTGVKINFCFSKSDIAKMKLGFRKIVEILFEMGATKVIPSSFKEIVFDSMDDLDNLDKWIKRPDDLLLGSAHPQGGNRMSDNPMRGVVDSSFKVHGYDNLYVVDASIFPYNIWANCQATVMAISKYASKSILAES